jgi:steroid 5-alpha reductase family enzyme
MTQYIWILIVVQVYMAGWFAFSQLRRRNDVADTAWGLGFVVVAWTSLLFGEQGPSAVTWLVTGLVSIWGARLAVHISMRNRKKSEDKRYKQIVPEGGSFRWLRSYLKVFVLQGLLLWVISLPIQAVRFAEYGDVSRLFVGVGVLLWAVGFYFEARGDYELRTFLAQPKRSKVLDTGLWRYTRHPNYFGELTLWWGVFVIAMAVGVSGWVIVGPLTITTLILFVSGIPMLERRYAEDVDYQRYAAKTSKFIPLPPKH